MVEAYAVRSEAMEVRSCVHSQTRKNRLLKCGLQLRDLV